MAAQDIHIVITDRNPHVRELLVRELLREGYRVTEARNLAHLTEVLAAPARADLVVLDPDICGMGRCAGLDPGNAAIVLHVIESGQCDVPPKGLTPAACVVKSGDLEGLKSELRRLAPPFSAREQDNPGADHV